MTSTRSSNTPSGQPASLRCFPYPYRAGLAIASDIDDTRSVDQFLEIQRFLNTSGLTSMGRGVGLEISNSFYFYDQKQDFSWFGREARARQVIIDLIHAGYIDSLHSYGDAADTREQVLRALDALEAADCHLDVWINHNGARTNLSRKFTYFFGVCEGDDVKSAAYHADVTLAFGIRFAWVGAMTRVIGQSPARSGSGLATVVDPSHPAHSALDVLKEFRKQTVGRWRGDPRFQIHRHNELTQVLELEDGQRVHEFMRYCDRPDDFDRTGIGGRHLAAGSGPPQDRRGVLHRIHALRAHSGLPTGCSAGNPGGSAQSRARVPRGFDLRHHHIEAAKLSPGPTVPGLVAARSGRADADPDRWIA